MSGGIIPSQTNTNKNNYFFALAGSGGGGGVASIIAGSNVSVSGTSNVTINAVGTVASIVAGSNISVSGTSNVTINATASAAGPSASNVSHYGTKTVTPSLIASGSDAPLFQIASTYFPNSNSSYLLSVVFSIPGATCSNVSGDISVFVNYDTTNVCSQGFTLQSQSSWSGLSNLNYRATMASTFIPYTGSNDLEFLIVNNTTGDVTPTAVDLTVSITGLTTSNVVANGWP
jgi:hypothetical protein